MTEDGRAAVARSAFPVPLEDTSLRWVYAREDHLVPFPLPAVGETVRIAADLPMPGQ